MSSAAPTDELLNVLGNKYSAEILCATQTPSSAKMLSDELEIPIATCYRRIDELVEVGLLKQEGSEFSGEGRRTDLYRRTIDGLTIDLDGDRPGCTLEKRSEAQNRLHDSRIGR